VLQQRVEIHRRLCDGRAAQSLVGGLKVRGGKGRVEPGHVRGQVAKICALLRAWPSGAMAGRFSSTSVWP
jgi:hypothetical protein